jgi:hypothetical protein
MESRTRCRGRLSNGRIKKAGLGELVTTYTAECGTMAERGGSDDTLKNVGEAHAGGGLRW